MKIRKYNPKDNNEVEKLIRTTLCEIFGKHKIPPFENFSEYNYFLVMEDKDIMIATIALKIIENKGVVKRLYVKKEYRKKGIAQKLYDKIEELARKNNINILELSTTPQMNDAIEFYKKNGFKKTRKNTKANSIFFEKRLK